jgi:YbbR domain-containing protein
VSVVPGIVGRNWQLKLAAFGMAVFLWAVVRVEPNGTGVRTLTDVPVLVEVGDPAWTTSGPPQPRSVDVRVGGAFGAFGRPDEDVIVRVPIEAVAGRDTVVELRRDWVAARGESGLQVQDINPPRIRITFEETAEAAVPISLRTENDLPQDLALAQPLSVNPAVVRVRGRRSRVEQLESIGSVPLDLSSVQGSGTFGVALDTAGFSDLTFRSTEATVGVRLEPAVEQVFAGIPIALDEIPEGVDTTEVVTRPATVQLTLRGGRTRVAAVQREDLRGVVSARVFMALRPGEQRVVPLRILGVPELVRATSAVDSVRLVRVDRGQTEDTAGASADSAATGGGVGP